MATSLSFSLTLSSSSSDPHIIPASTLKKFSLLHPPTPSRLSFKSFSSSPSAASASAIYTNLEDTFKTGKFLTNEELHGLKTLQDFSFRRKLVAGSMWVRVMRQEEMDAIVGLLSESFAESLLLRSNLGYVRLLRYFVKQYLVERRELLPHSVVLVAYYKGDEEEKEEKGAEQVGNEELAGTLEVYLNKRAFISSAPSPTPPEDCPYICNMSVKDSLRRKGIGWNLLKASEELISQMTRVREVYLHCRMIDSAPLSMYTKAGYTAVKTDSILVLLLLQRRKYLMRKILAVESFEPETSTSTSNVELSS